MKHSSRILLILLGWLFVALGSIGAVLPLVPTTPFLILAALCFSKGSERLHRWLLERPVFGPLILEWERNGVIRPKAKILSTIMIVLLFAISLLVAKVHIILKGLVILIGAGVLFFIWTRPSSAKSISVDKDS